MLKLAEPGATFLLNSPFDADNVWDKLPRLVQQQIITKKLKFYVIDGDEVAKVTGMGGRINTIMQTCFFAISGVLPREEAIAAIKYAIKKTYGKRGETVVQKNYAAVDASLSHLQEVKVPDKVTSLFDLRPPVPAAAPAFVRDVLAQIIAGNGDDLPVSAMPIDGTFPTATAQWEKRNIALEIPVWDEALCIQCGKCVLVCPHAVIRAKVYDDSYLGNAPAAFKAVPARWKDMKDRKYTLQVAPEDCTGCTLCVEVCPAKSKSEVKHRAINMVPQPPLRETEAANWDFFLSIPETDRKLLSPTQVKDIQLLQPLFEFSGACSGCGETPYIKLITQLFGDRMMIANATGCSSIYGGNLPTTPYCTNDEGRGPVLVQLALRRQRRVRPRHAPGRRQAERVRPRTGLASRLPDRRGTGAGHPECRPEDRSRASSPSASASSNSKRNSPASIPRKPATCSAWPMPWSRRASGSSAAMAGPTTSATAASITCSPPAATSTSWCSIPRSTPTPAARRPSPRRAARSPSSPPAANRPARRISPSWP